MRLRLAVCACCGREIVALRREQEPVCQSCEPAPRKQGLLALLFSLVG
jgi:hypothetical protein